MSTGKRIVFLFCAFALLVALVFLLASYAQHQRHNRMLEVASMIQLSVERYAVDHDGRYPQSLDQLRKAGYLQEIPGNPVGSGSVPLLKPGDPAQPGGVVYIPLGPIIAMPQPAGYPDQPDLLAIPAATSPNWEVDAYFLAIYGDHTCNSAVRQQELQSILKKASGSAAARKAGAKVDWARVEVLLHQTFH